jgi:hypothetical protein
MLERWFGPDGAGAGSYAAGLVAAGLKKKEVTAVAARYRRQLGERVVDWESWMIFGTAKA